MLVLTRRTDESVFIGNDISVTLIRARDGSARLGITAPRDVPISRSERVERAAAVVASSRDNGRPGSAADSSDSAESCATTAVVETGQ